MAKGDHPPGSEPFDVTLPEGFELGVHRSALEAAAKQAGWTIERDGALIVVRDVWTENEDHAAWLGATKVGLPPTSSGSGAGSGLVESQAHETSSGASARIECRPLLGFVQGAWGNPGAD